MEILRDLLPKGSCALFSVEAPCSSRGGIVSPGALEYGSFSGNIAAAAAYIKYDGAL